MFKNVKVSYQNNGSNWLIILNGKEEDIALAFNSFWNLRATSGELEWNGPCSAHFWTYPKPKGDCKNSLWGYFYNYYALHAISYEKDEIIKQRARAFVQKRVRGLQSSKDYRAKVSEVYERMTRFLIAPMADKTFAEFAANNLNPFKVSFSVDANEYATREYGLRFIEDEDAGNKEIQS
jgi:hypothetical protein